MTTTWYADSIDGRSYLFVVLCTHCSPHSAAPLSFIPSEHAARAPRWTITEQIHPHTAFGNANTPQHSLNVMRYPYRTCTVPQNILLPQRTARALHKAQANAVEVPQKTSQSPNAIFAIGPLPALRSNIGTSRCRHLTITYQSPLLSLPVGPPLCDLILSLSTRSR